VQSGAKRQVVHVANGVVVMASANAKKVSMGWLKRFAAERLPLDSELGQVLLEMKDEVGAEEFIGFLPILLKLSRIESRKGGE
jgi:hypothetical protein